MVGSFLLLEGSFALRSDLLLPIAAKVGKSARRNLRFLHFRARYVLSCFVCFYRTITLDYLFRFVKKIVSAPASLPLMPTPNNASVSTVENVSGSGAKGTDDASYVTTTTVYCEHVV